MFFSKFNAQGLLDGFSWIMALIGFFLGSSLGEPRGWPMWVPLIFALVFYGITVPTKKLYRKRQMEKAGIDPGRRAQQLGVDELRKIYEELI